jgi:hypothetical protein
MFKNNDVVMYRDHFGDNKKYIGEIHGRSPVFETINFYIVHFFQKPSWADEWSSYILYEDFLTHATITELEEWHKQDLRIR